VCRATHHIMNVQRVEALAVLRIVTLSYTHIDINDTVSPAGVSIERIWGHSCVT